MFSSFFPRPKMFFTSLIVWTAFCVALWYAFWQDLGTRFGMGPMEEEAKPIGLGFFVTPDSIWFYSFFIGVIVLFGGFWHLYAREQKWRAWSIWGSAFILFVTKYGVEVSVSLNNWRRPFFDKIQEALAKPNTVPAAEFFHLLLVFFQIAAVAVAVFVLLRFVVSHYVFRWRTAMNDFYLNEWARLRNIEGASQRIQEDTMNFATYVEDLGVSLVSAVMTLIAFLPILYELSRFVTDIPFVGSIPAPLVTAAILWAIFGTIWLWVFGIRLPGLEFRNQRVEAAFRKELVYGEDDAARAQPVTVTELYDNVRRNYFRLYFHYLYFNVARGFYGQADAIFVYVILVPSFAAGAFTFGVMQQILTAFGEVSNSFQYLVNSWNDIIKLMSIYKRLRSFEAAINDEPLVEIDVAYIQTGGAEDKI